MEHPTDKQSLLEQVTAATVKVVSGRAATKSGFGETIQSQPSTSSIANRSLDSYAQLAIFRGNADAAALRLRYHDPILHKQCLPKRHEYQQVFEWAEQARVDALGSLRFRGVAINVLAKWTQHVIPHETQAGRHSPQTLAYVILSKAIENNWQGIPTTQNYKYSSRLSSLLLEKLHHSANAVNEQSTFAQSILDILPLLDLGATTALAQKAPERKEPSGSPRGCADTDGSAEKNESEFDENGEKQTEPSKVPPCTKNNQTPKASSLDRYKAFDTTLDQISHADELASPEELRKLRQQLDQSMGGMHSQIARLANRLHRFLLGQQRSSWDFHLEDGLLNTNHLASFISNPLNPLRYKQEKPAPFRDTAVTLLIDNSGSMRGDRIEIAAMCSDILARTLERCNVRVEVLGYTTRYQAGGPIIHRWKEAGQPVAPGRLNALRHIVYKDADEPWRRAKNKFGLMLSDELLQENIDGEALEWAANRLLARPEQRRMLIVISDGTPYDGPTFQAHEKNYLIDHLAKVVNMLEKRPGIDLSAIGIGHDVSRSYQQAVTLYDANELGEALMDRLTQLFAHQGIK